MSEELETEEMKQDVPGDALDPGTKLLNGQFVIDRFLNAGGFGMTYLAKDSLERTVVIKECYPNTMCCRSKNFVRARSRTNQIEFQTIVSLFGHEARRLSKLKHPHIVGIHQVFEDNETAYMVLDYIDGYDLMDTIEHRRDRLQPSDIKDVLVKILGAVSYIHDHDILHRDISPDNILMDKKMHPTLIDFGAAREEATRASRILSQLHVVKDGYSPQEFYLAGTAQDRSSDLYALAASFYHIITGKVPPNSQRRVAAIASSKDDPYVPLSSRTIPGFDEFFLSAIDIAMNVFPGDRLQTAEEWLERIDTMKRQEKKLVEARNDRKLEDSISKMVAEVNGVMADDGQLADGETPPDYVRDRLGETEGILDPGDSRPSIVGRLFSWMRGRESDGAKKPATNHNEAEK